MISPARLSKMLAAAPMLEPPAPEVVCELIAEIDRLGVVNANLRNSVQIIKNEYEDAERILLDDVHKAEGRIAELEAKSDKLREWAREAMADIGEPYGLLATGYLPSHWRDDLELLVNAYPPEADEEDSND